MQKSVRRILSVAVLVLLIGIFISYYNTASFGYDNANIISFNNEEVRVFDTYIKYDKIKEKTNKIKKFIPSKNITI